MPLGKLWLGVLAIGPSMVLVHVYWARDRQREPVGNLLVYVLLGALSVVPAALLEGVATELFAASRAWLTAAVGLPLYAVLGVALLEELPKRILLGLRAARDPHLEEPFDWIVYGVAVGLGFATVENVLYVYRHGTETGLLRAVTAVPAHAFLGTLMGWRLARAMAVSSATARRERQLSLVEPVLWHAAYDLPLFAARAAAPGLFLTLFLVLLVWLWRLSAARVATLAAEQHLPSPPVLVVDALARRLKERRRSRLG